jgi:spermidine synthase
VAYRVRTVTHDILNQAEDVRIGEDGGRAALLVNGVVQSISPEDSLVAGGYWGAMVPDDRPRHGLILGLGGGTIARLLHARWGPFPILGVDDDPTVLDLARDVGWLPREALEIVIADAFAFVKSCQERYDYVAVDLFHGEEMDRRIFGQPFLRRVRALLAPRGQLAVNMFADLRQLSRITRIASFFEIRERRYVGGNLVVHARRRR